MFEAKTGAYHFWLDEDWFRLDANLLREALEITFVDQDHQVTFFRPKYPVLQMLWGIITRTNIEYVELMWEEFVQDIQTFLIDKANLGSPTKKGKKEKPYVIPYSRFTKLIIYYLERYHNIHQRSGSPLNLVEYDLSLGNLKFIPKGEIDEVFRMKIPEELITDNIRNAPYYNAYLKMVAKHERGIPITPRVLGSLTSSINSQCIFCIVRVCFKS
nr:histone deacetylase 14 [Tanacetum cinerariifolium]